MLGGQRLLKGCRYCIDPCRRCWLGGTQQRKTQPMIFRIPAGKHRARPFRFGLWWRRTHFSWVVKFDESCRYDLGSSDQYDINKLVGIGYLWHHHDDSARFGWSYNREAGGVDLWAYCYVNGRREIQHICFCEIGKEYMLMLNATSIAYHLHAYDRYSTTPLGMITIGHDHNKRLQYRLSPFFGGNRPAPHEIMIDLKKLG